MRFALLILFVAVANAAELLRVAEPISGEYIVKIKSGITVESVLPSVRLAGGRVSFVHNLINGFSAELSEKVLDMVLNLPSVEYVEENGIVRTMDVESWGLDRVDQRYPPLDGRYVPDGDGRGVDVYILDTGIRITHSDFGGRAKWGANFVDSRNTDDNGHGTHCAGTVGGNAYGVAKGVTLYAVKVLNARGSGSYSGIIAGIDWVAGRSGKRVASMSLGGGRSTSLNQAVQNANRAGVSVVVAAGNSNDDASNYSPASAAAAMTVGSSTRLDERSSFSNYGTSLSLFAPGSGIKSAWYTSDTATNTISGTSMACPHVAGAVAQQCAKMGSWQSCAQAEGNVLGGATAPEALANNLGSPQLMVYVGN